MSGSERRNGSGIVIRGKYGRPRNQHLGAGGENLLHVVRLHASVYFQKRPAPGAVDQSPDLGNLA